MGKVEVTRQELYNLVWYKPISKLALEYNLSDNGLRKICKMHEIPLPVLVHWQIIQYIIKVKVIPLPKGQRLLLELEQLKKSKVPLSRSIDTWSEDQKELMHKLFYIIRA